MEPNALRTESLFKLTWPIYLQNTTNSLVMFADFWFFSYLSDEIAGVIGQLLPIFWMGAFVIPVFAGTGISVASQFMGARQDKKVVPTYMMNLFMSSGLGLSFATLLLLFSSKLGLWIGMDQRLSAFGGDYFSVIAYYFVFMSCLVAYNAILSSRGMTHWLMYSSFLISSLNIALNSLFVLVFDWGIRGIAWGSVISVFVALLLSVYLVHKKLGIVFYFKGIVADMFGVLRPMLRLGISNALEPFSYSVQQIILSTFIVSLGVTSMATNSYAGRLQMFQITFGFSLASAAQILMAHWAGAKKYESVEKLYWKTLRYSMIVAFLSCIVIWFFFDAALSLFTSDPDIKLLGKSVLFVAIFLEPARAVNIIGGFSLRTVGDARFPLIVGMAFIWGILPIIYFLDRWLTLSLVGFWACFALDEIVRAGINIWRWQTGKWKYMGFVRDE